MNKNTILIVAPSAYTLSGLATWLDYMEPELLKKGWKVIVGLVEGPSFHKPDNYLAKHQHQNAISICCNTQTHIGRIRAVVKALEQVEPQLVMTVNLPDVILGAAKWRNQEKNDLKIIMAVHGIQPDIYDDIRMYRNWIDAACCTNRLACELAVRIGEITASRVHYVPCGIHQANSLGLEQSGKKLTIAYVGRLEEDQKRVHDLPDILDELDEAEVPYQLLIAGNGPEEADLRRLFSTRMEQGTVVFMGFLTPEKLHETVLEKCDVLLLTSSWETGPLVIWEAMSHAVAIVSSRYIGSGLEGALKHEENAFMFEIGQPQEAARQLKRLWVDPDLRSDLGQKGLQLVNERYSIPASMRNWDRELRSILSSRAIECENSIPFYSQPDRLGRIVGEEFAETIRSCLGRVGPKSEAGGEWPHTHARTPYKDRHFWRLVRQLDRKEELT